MLPMFSLLKSRLEPLLKPLFKPLFANGHALFGAVFHGTLVTRKFSTICESVSEFLTTKPPPPQDSSATQKQQGEKKTAHKRIPTAPEQDIQADIQREIRSERKFSLAEAIGREGGSFMKGDSAVPRPLRAKTEINQFIAAHLSEPTGALATSLCSWTNEDIRVSRQLDTPLVALVQIVDSLLSESTTFCEFARQVAIAQAQLTGERPYFQLHGQAAHPEADYTHDSISADLIELLKRLLTHLEASEKLDFSDLRAGLKTDLTA